MTLLTTQSSQSSFLESDFLSTVPESSMKTHTGEEVELEVIDKHYDSIDLHASLLKEKKVKKKVVRRLRGFIFDFDNDEAIVNFVVKDEEYHYTFPKHFLKKNGISEKNQPFEMDEIEIEDKNGLHLVTEFRPMAKIDSGSLTPFDLNTEENNWYKTIQNHDYVEI